jgi:type III secretion protein T
MDTIELAALQAWFMPVALTLPRLLAVFAIAPFFSGNLMSGLVRNGIVLVLALYMSPAASDLPELTLGGWVLVAAKEAFIGVLLGLGFGIFVWAVQSVGDLVDFQTGSASAPFFDPIGGHEGGPTGQFLGWVVITLFMSAGGMLAMVRVIIDSFRLWPVASFHPRVGPMLEQFVIRQGDTLFLWTLKLAAPVIFVLLLVELGIGLIGRVAPPLNVFVFAQPVKSVLANLMLLLCMYFLYDSLREFLRPENGVLEFLRSAL